MEPTVSAVALADERKLWKTHPLREGQWCAELSKDDLFWKDCPAISSHLFIKANIGSVGLTDSGICPGMALRIYRSATIT